MKVSIITDIPRLLEKNMYLRELEFEARKRGIEIRVFVIKTPDWLPLDKGFPIYRVLRAASLTCRLCDSDILHVQFTLPFGFTYTLTKPLHRLPVLIHTHGYDVFVVRRAKYGLRQMSAAKLFTKLTWNAASGIIAVCQRAKDEILKEGIESEKVHVLYNGIDERFFFKRKNVDSDKLNSLRQSSDIIFLTVGNLVPIKNHANLLLAFKKYLEDSKHRPKSTLLIAGRGPLEEQLHALVERLGIRKSVVFLGQTAHEKMPEIYSIADAFILPSISEAHPWSLLEAMSCQLPAAASMVGGIPETINDSRFLFDPWSVNDIYRGIQFLAEDPESKSVGIRNRKIVLEHFTIEKHIANLHSIYTNMQDGETPLP